MRLFASEIQVPLYRNWKAFKIYSVCWVKARSNWIRYSPCRLATLLRRSSSTPPYICIWSSPHWERWLHSTLFHLSTKLEAFYTRRQSAYWSWLRQICQFKRLVFHHSRKSIKFFFSTWPGTRWKNFAAKLCWFPVRILRPTKIEYRSSHFPIGSPNKKWIPPDVANVWIMIQLSGSGYICLAAHFWRSDPVHFGRHDSSRYWPHTECKLIQSSNSRDIQPCFISHFLYVSYSWSEQSLPTS